MMIWKLSWIKDPLFHQPNGHKEALEEVAGKTIYQIKDDARESVREKKLAEGNAA